MNFIETPLSGAYQLLCEEHLDERGGFARVYCEEEFRKQGIACSFAQDNLSWNPCPNILRGLHYQAAPHGEDKLIRCIGGAAFDVAVDVRPESATYLQWFGAVLSEENRLALYLPRGFAHGFQTLRPHTALYYKSSFPYTPASERGLRYNDPLLGVAWPLENPICSEKDRTWPLLQRKEIW